MVRSLTLLLAVVYLTMSCATTFRGGVAPRGASHPLDDSGERARAVHLLNRLTYGPRPGDVDRVLAEGSEHFITEQLDASGPPDTVLARRLQAYDVVASPRDLTLAYQEYQARQRRSGELGNLRKRGILCAPADGTGLQDLENRVARQAAETETARLQQIDRRVNQLVAQYQQVTVLRAALSERQLYEIMVDFWTNHFNVFVGKATDRFLIRSYIEEAIRPFAFGKFENLLVATATSPAMLVYLDNAESVAPGAVRPRPSPSPSPPSPAPGEAFSATSRCHLAPPKPPPPRQPGETPRRPVTGLNENYGRELLELHTLGVDGGYSQQDVFNVARMFTGWSVMPATEEPGFAFNAWAHDRNEKLVLGRLFPARGGMEEGLVLLRMLARHPATIHHVSAKLCARFVSDDPPTDCVKVATRAWKRTDGDIREILRAIVRSRSFWDPLNRDAKVKTPLQFVVSAMRAVAADPDTTLALAQLVARLGEPLFGQIAPTGYPDSQQAWMNAGALLQRWNVAIQLAAGAQAGVRVHLDQVAPTLPVDSVVAAVNRNVLNGAAGPATLHALATQANGVARAEDTRALLVGLALGSPEFERH